MNNYHYIIAGLPELLPDFHAEGFRYKVLESSIREQLSARDSRLVDWLDFGSDTSHLSGHFYRAVARQKSGFLRSYFDMDRRMRNAQVEFLSARDGLDSARYTVGETESYKEDFPELQTVFQCTDLYEREKRLDMFRWEKITGMTVFHYFDMDVILAFILKLHIIDRWHQLDEETGREMFRKLVNEVKATFKGVEYNPERSDRTDNNIKQQ